jgi:UDPglucose 6-dehydrogenase
MTREGIMARDQIVEIYANWVPREKIITSNVWSSELSKLAANAFLAQRISSINSISALCEKSGADVSEVSRVIGMDDRIGNRFLMPSFGFGGSCFKKDLLNLVYICRSYGLKDVADYWDRVVRMNEHQKCRFVRNILKAMFDTVAEKKIALFGFAFKANTGDTRESPAIDIAKQLIDERAKVVISDPKALDSARIDLAGYVDKLEFTSDPYKAAHGAHAIAIMTEWEEYKEFDYKKIFTSMEKPAFIFDGRNILDHEKLFKIGFNVFRLGRSSLINI